jgi:hypothetical protein
MIKKFFVTLLATATLFTSCKSDDDNKELSAEQQDSLDDQAIEEYLERHYFSTDNGKIATFDTITGNEDDNYPSLKQLAVKDPAGFYYAYRPGVTAEGPSIVSSEASEILISYDVKTFQATNDEQYKYKYGSIYDYANTINSGDGSATIDPSFYYYELTEAQIKNGIKREHVELKYFAEALKKFKSTLRSGRDQYNFQGIIILPSRLAYGRNKMYTGSAVTTRHSYRNASFIFNFELDKVTPRDSE